jgi:uncharacterized iron-regulated membrane protein
MSAAVYRTIWRWHFYAGLFVIPFVLILSISGAMFLFKPQIDRWEERAYQGLPLTGAVSPDAQLSAALKSFQNAQFKAYRIPDRFGDAAMITLKLPGARERDVFIGPDGRVLGSLTPNRISSLIAHFHGQLLLGKPGSYLVELAASWAIVLIVSGLYLWWPRGQGLAGTVWPRLGDPRKRWRDLHAVTGFWVAGLALVLLFTGLPWASVWGDSFRAVRTHLGLLQGKQDWTIGGQNTDGDHARHDMTGGRMAMPTGPNMRHVAPAVPPPTLGLFVARAGVEHLRFPAIVTPPGEDGKWTIKSDTQNRPQRIVIRYDAATGMEVSRITSADAHPIDKVVNVGIAWHEGQLFGWVNQLVGLFTAAALVALTVSGFVMWRRHKSVTGGLGAPLAPGVPAGIGGAIAILIVFALLLPLVAISLIVIFTSERLVLSRIPAVRDWLGLASTEPNAT